MDDETTPAARSKFEKVLGLLKTHSASLWIFVTAILLILGGWVTLDAVIESRVSKALASQSVLDELARRLNTHIVFNGKGAVLNDPHGVFGSLITGIKITPKIDEYDGVDTGKVPDESSSHALVMVSFNRALDIPPILNYYDMEAHIVGNRVGEANWEFEVRQQVVYGVGPPGVASPSTKFLLQIFR